MSRKKIYDYSKCYEIAKQCSSRSEMRRKNHWLDDYDWLARKQHTPYTYDEVYEIAKSYTCSSDFQRGNGSAYGKAREKGWIKDYTWFCTKQHAPYTYEQCYDEAKKFKSRLELAKGNVGVYQAALNHGWLDSYTWFEEQQKPAGYWDNYKNCYEAALKCKNKSEFSNRFNRACVIATKKGWIKDYTWLDKKRIAHNKKWDYDSVREEAKKYKSRKEFSTNARGAYKVACANGWMNDYAWFDNTHEVLSKAVKAARPSKWTYDVCKQIALDSKGRLDFRKKSSGAYNASWANKWLDDFFPKGKKSI